MSRCYDTKLHLNKKSFLSDKFPKKSNFNRSGPRLNEGETGTIYVVRLKHLCKNNIFINWRNPIDINHFANINVKNILQIRVFRPSEHPLNCLKSSTENVWPSHQTLQFKRTASQNKKNSIHLNTHTIRCVDLSNFELAHR